MEIRQLEYFLAVIEHNGVNRAAQHLHIAQATLSQGIRQLERELKLELFHRTGRNLVLNSAGRLLVEPARKILDEMLSTKDLMRGALELSAGSISIGTMPEMSSEAVAAWSGSFTKQFPDVRIDMTEYPDVEVLCAEVLNGHCEIGFTTFPLPVDGLEEIDFGVQRLLLVRPPHSVVSEAQPAALSELGELDLVVRNMAHRENDIVAQSLTHHQVDVKIKAQVPTRHAQLSMVLNGTGSAFLPIRMAVLAKKLGANVVQTEPTISSPFGIVHRAGSLNPAAESFARLSQRALNRWTSLIRENERAGESLLIAGTHADEILHGQI